MEGRAVALITQVFVAPGNAGTAFEPKTRNVDISADNLPALEVFAKGERIDLTIVGPEGPLVAGVVDRFEAAGLRCFGPVERAAQLEGSKAYTKEFLRRHRIPTAASRTFTRGDVRSRLHRSASDPDSRQGERTRGGQGRRHHRRPAQAIDTAQSMFAGQFGEAGREVVIEEFLAGEEVSFIVMADGRHILPLATSQDHKRRDDGDRGPNTGGMGAYSPAPIVTPLLHARIMREVIEPTILGLAEDGTPYTGFLYAGLMIAEDGTPNVLEFNCRFWRPGNAAGADATQIGPGPALHCSARWAAQPRRCAMGFACGTRCGDGGAGLSRQLSERRCHHRARRRGATARKGLPRGHEACGKQGCDQRRPCALRSGARCDSIRGARRDAYALVDAIQWPGAQFRRDIGYRAIARGSQLGAALCLRAGLLVTGAVRI